MTTPPAPPPAPAADPPHASNPSKRFLDGKKVNATLEELCLRIDERFPGSGLSRVARELLAVGRETESVIAQIERPIYRYRIACGAVVLLALVVFGFAVYGLEIDFSRLTIADVVQMTEAGLNELVLIGAAMVFLVSMETRVKRQVVLGAVNRLTALAHVIDAHTLRKDPQSLHKPEAATLHSPKRLMSDFELGRYLDYCSELLALTGKIGFLYVQNFDDPVSAEVVNDLEMLTTGLSRKIWQKIVLLKPE
ncbi:MAG: hypothetical protein HS116_19555 [Planctomycetes bacterium]|nr:hypothetical protein [Planctomycetota bacterium]